MTPLDVLVLSTGNAARSIMAPALEALQRVSLPLEGLQNEIRAIGEIE